MNDETCGQEKQEEAEQEEQEGALPPKSPLQNNSFSSYTDSNGIQSGVKKKTHRNKAGQNSEQAGSGE